MLHIAGHWREGRHSKRHPVFDPATGKSIGSLGLASVDDIDDAIAAAECGFEAWKRVPAFKRSEALHAASQRMQERGQEIARLLTLEQGKPLAEALAEVASTVNVIRWYAEEARRVYGRIIPPRVPGSSMEVLREPVGPCAAFSP
jgi:succinate-semialdehyde dehydrogenase / glutarate-semialdehyde dehydrogenase